MLMHDMMYIGIVGATPEAPYLLVISIVATSLLRSLTPKAQLKLILLELMT